jgi:hypothetical protein
MSPKQSNNAEPQSMLYLLENFKFIVSLIYLFIGIIGVLTQGLTLVRQALYYLSHIPAHIASDF